jgi:PAS domain-containing protein
LNKKPKISDDSDNLRFPGNEKDFSDQIINHSRSMISIINREYVYEKVNSTFCKAHQVKVDSIVGKSLEDVWGYDTFQNIIKSNIDSCFSGKTIRY